MTEIDGSAPQRMRRGLGSAVKKVAVGTLRYAGPPAILAFLAASAVAPVAISLLGVTTGAFATAAVQLLGGMGGNYLADVMVSAAGKLRGRGKPVTEDEMRAVLVEELTARLTGSGADAAGLRGEISGLLGDIQGVRVALESSSKDVRGELAAGLLTLGTDFAEFRWILASTADTTLDIQRMIGDQLADHRRQISLAEQALFQITALRADVLSGLDQRRPDQDSPEPPGDSECPYRGLAAFQAQDVRWFFGRARLTSVLVGQLAARAVSGGVLVVLGPSGSGKSSLVRAGLTGAVLRDELRLPHARGWPVRFVVPGADPVLALAEQLTDLLGTPTPDLRTQLAEAPEAVAAQARSVLLGERQRLLLVVDQAEELFTQCDSPATRRQFLAALDVLTSASEEAVPVALAVLAARADFTGRFTEHSELARWVADSPVLVGAMTRAELADCVELPALAAGLTVEPGLVELLISDLGAARRTDGDDLPKAYPPGALPQLGYALLATWRLREGTTLTVDGYRRSGGIGGAIAQAAEDLYSSWDPERQKLARALLTALVAVPEDADAVRRRLSREELLPTDGRAHAEEVLAELAGQRLVTMDEHTVELSHEALLSNWPRLRDWLNEDRETLVRQRQLAAAARSWHTEGRSPDALWRGARLQAAPAPKSTVEDEFLTEASRAERRRLRARRLAVAALVVMLVAAVTGVGLALREASASRQQAREALSRQLAADSTGVFSTDQRSAQLHALAAWRTEQTIEARGAVIGQELNSTVGKLIGHNSLLGEVALTADGGTAATAGSDGVVMLWDTRTREIRHKLMVSDTAVGDVAFSPDGKRLVAVTGTLGKGMQVWDVVAGKRLLTVPTSALTVAHHPRDPVAAIGESDKAVHLRSTVDGSELGVLAGHTGFLSAIEFSPNGRLLATADHTGGLRLWDVAARKTLFTLSGHKASIGAVAFSPDGSRMVTASLDGSIRFWSTSTGNNVFTVDVSSAGPTSSVAYLPDGGSVVAGVGTQVRLIDTSTYEDSIIDGMHTGAIFGVAAAGPGRMMVAVGERGEAVLYNYRNTGLYGHTSAAICVAFHPNGQLLASTGDTTVRFWDVRDRMQLGGIPLPQGVFPQCVEFSPDGSRVVTSFSDGTVRVWDTASRTELDRLNIPDRRPIAVRFSPDGKRVAVAAHMPLPTTTGPQPTGKPSVQVWTPMTGAVRVFETEEDPAGLVFAPNAPLFAYGDARGVVRLVNADTGLLVREFGTPRDRAFVNSVVFSPDGSRIAASAADKTITLWDTATGRAQPSIRTASPPRGLAFSPDGAMLATGAADPAIRLWRTEDLSLVAVLDRHNSRTNEIRFSPDGKLLASASGDHRVILWRTSAEDAVRAICGRISGPGLAEEWNARYREYGPVPC
ncbi:nSTAND1 domain-containing NTPase [Allokutzneria oryzae]|uniref:Novel STAND NTPase 1 domain-containing protein n=1 Tax=Allokutzneria oryzae TaxID=1378989 RepID=A0ABV5ZRX2_9PSEU